MYSRIFSCVERLTLSEIVNYLDARSLAIECFSIPKYSIDFLEVAVDHGFEVTINQKFKDCLTVDIQLSKLISVENDFIYRFFAVHEVGKWNPSIFYCFSKP